MGKIVGEVFEEYVQKQITVRQNKLGNTTYDNDLLTYTTSKDSWLRLSSGVDVNEDRLTKLPNIPLSEFPEGNSLASSYVLFGGANNINRSSKPKGGLISTYTDSILANASYGFDSTAEYGLVPLPGVTSFNIKPKNNGSITEGEIKIKCYNIQQFNHIESLYLRIGYTLLLEWGHTIYYRDENNLETQITDNTDSVLRKFIAGDKGDDTDPQAHILKEIAKARKKSAGNYDAAIGRVTNFDWNVSPTGEYEISISVISPGAIIESLSISVVLPNKRKEEGDEEGEDNTGIIDPIDSTTIGGILASFKKVLSQDFGFLGSFRKKETDLGALSDISDESENGNNFEYFYVPKSLTNANIATAASVGTEAFNDPEDQTSIPPREIVAIEPKSFDSKSEDSDSDRVFYVKFGALLRIIQNFLLLYNTNEINNPPIISIDWNYNDNKCFIPLTDLFSSNPSICAIPSRFKSSFERKGWFWSSNKTINFSALNNVLGKDWFGKSDYEYNFMHIYLGIDNLYSLLRNNINSEGELALINFLTAICTGINSSLSNQTEFTPFVDTDTNILHIVNKRNSDPILEDPPIPSKFQIGYLHNNGVEGLNGIKIGSFVKDVSIKSTLPPNFATQIAIGAQANEKDIPANATPFSNWNKGYTDRIVLKKTSPKSKTVEEENKEEEINEAFKNTVYNTNEAAYLYSNFIYDEDFTKLSTDINTYFKNDSAKQIKSTPGFTAPILIPISLSLTLDGLSGMKIFQKYTITDDFLPQSYRDNIEFIIKGLNHTIDDNGWITNIEGQFMPKSKRDNS